MGDLVPQPESQHRMVFHPSNTLYFNKTLENTCSSEKLCEVLHVIRFLSIPMLSNLSLKQSLRVRFETSIAGFSQYRELHRRGKYTEEASQTHPCSKHSRSSPARLLSPTSPSWTPGDATATSPFSLDLFHVSATSPWLSLPYSGLGPLTGSWC